MPDKRRPSPAAIERVKKATVHHFAVTNEQGNVPRLMRKVVDVLETLGEVEVHDITFCAEVLDSTFPVTMTVYVSFPEKDDQ